MGMGIERLISKKSKATLYFISDENAPFYSGQIFIRILQFVQLQVLPSQMNEKNNKLTLTFHHIINIDKLYLCIEKMFEYITKEHADLS